jgi:hypothetical protein
MEHVTIHRIQLEFGSEELQGEPTVVLRRLATAYLEKRKDQEYLAMLRVVIGESDRFPELAQLFTRTVIQRGLMLLTHYLKNQPDLQLADPEAIARIFFGTLVSFLVNQELLYGKLDHPFDQQRLVDSLVGVVLGDRP